MLLRAAELQGQNNSTSRQRWSARTSDSCVFDVLNRPDPTYRFTSPLAHCPWLASTFWQALLILARFSFRHMRKESDPALSGISRQNRRTSRRHAASSWDVPLGASTFESRPLS